MVQLAPGSGIAIAQQVQLSPGTGGEDIENGEQNVPAAVVVSVNGPVILTRLRPRFLSSWIVAGEHPPPKATADASQ